MCVKGWRKVFGVLLATRTQVPGGKGESQYVALERRDWTCLYRKVWVLLTKELLITLTKVKRCPSLKKREYMA